MEISATLEKEINKVSSDKDKIDTTAGSLKETLYLLAKQSEEVELRFDKIEKGDGLNHLCWRLSMIILAGFFAHSENPEQLTPFLQGMYKLLHASVEFRRKFREANTRESLNSAAIEFAEELTAIQEQIMK